MILPESTQLRHLAGEVRIPRQEEEREEEGRSMASRGHPGRLPRGGDRWSGKCHSHACKAIEVGVHHRYMGTLSN